MKGTSKLERAVAESREEGCAPAGNPVLFPQPNGSWRMPGRNREEVGLAGSSTAKKKQVSDCSVSRICRRGLLRQATLGGTASKPSSQFFRDGVFCMLYVVIPANCGIITERRVNVEECYTKPKGVDALGWCHDVIHYRGTMMTFTKIYLP